MIRDPARTVLLDVTEAGNRLVAVGAGALKIPMPGVVPGGEKGVAR